VRQQHTVGFPTRGKLAEGHDFQGIPGARNQSNYWALPADEDARPCEPLDAT
jgi:hypothetical protein